MQTYDVLIDERSGAMRGARRDVHAPYLQRANILPSIASL